MDLDSERSSDHEPVSISLFLDDAAEAFATYKPPANVSLDTTTLEDGEHHLHFRAIDRLGNVGRRTIRFVVANGPGISVTGLRDGKMVSGSVDFNLNAFGGQEPFDALRAESQNPIPVWMWVVTVVFVAWAGWYALENFPTPPNFAATPTYAADPSDAIAAVGGTAQDRAPTASSGKSLAGFDYGTLGANAYATNCQACHGASGAGIPAAFPSLVGDPVVTESDPKQHILTVLRGLHGKTIKGVTFSSQMPAFSQLSDADIAAAIDHERTSWGNKAPTITPDDVKRSR